MPTFKLGRTPAKWNAASLVRMAAMTRHLDALGAPPAMSPDWTTAVTKQAPNGWLMFANGPDPTAPAPLAQGMGDCVAASTFHADMLRTANVGTISIPTTEQVLAFYAILQGYKGDPTNAAAVLAFLEQNDNGANESTAEQILTKTGYLNIKLDGSANLDPKQLDQLKWGICIFGAVRLGLNLPDSAQDQFSNNQPWTPVANAQLDGGHDIQLVGYNGIDYFGVSWGALVTVTPAFLTAKYDDGTPYLEEAHAELAFDWVNQAGTCPANLNLPQLLADLSAIVEPSPTPQPTPVPPPPSPPTPPTPTPVPPVATVSKKELGYLMNEAIEADMADKKMGVDDMVADLASILNEVNK